MELKALAAEFSVCKIADLSEADLSAEFCFLSKTDEEISLVCPVGAVPSRTLEREDGWKAFRIEGVLDFSLVGILARISSILAEHEIGIFAISTYNTDYILVKEKNFSAALSALSAKGYSVI